MGTEIERKFLVRDSSVIEGLPGLPYRQGYLSTDPERTVRIRLAGEHAWLTVKGATTGATRAEFEYSIPPADAVALLAMCAGPLVEKTRHQIEHAGRTWEIDVFAGDNAGLVLAEVELPAEDVPLDVPPWAGEEVTHDARYVNARLVAHPYRTWARDGNDS
jgi:adenylate cyclase